MSRFTLLEEGQIFGTNQSGVISRRGTEAAITDFSILLGGYVNDDCHVPGDNSLKGRTGGYWTKTPYNGDARAVSHYGCDWFHVDRRDGAVRPASPFSKISEIPTNGVSGKRARDGILEVEYGYYPQTAAPANMQAKLSIEYKKGSIQKSGNGYTVDSRHYDEYNNSFFPQRYKEYEYNGKRYVRVTANSYYDGEKFTLSNGEKYRDGDAVWVEVEPVKWLVDEQQKIMIAEKLIFAGVQFNFQRNYKGNFGKTDLNKFMYTYFEKDLVQGRNLYKQGQQTPEEEVSEKESGRTRKKNPYNFNFENVSEEEIIKGAVKSNVAVFLHGGSGDGKSARVKQIDPDCEIIYLRNATPESLNGKSVYNSETGEMIDVKPTWLKKLEEKCETEKEKIHILFFDEITNALPAIQGMAFNIVLDGEVNGRWELPENARIVAAGNDLSDSLAANTLAEPLFNRFAHVYIETTTESWLKWAASPKEEYKRLPYEPEKKPEAKIHPSIYAYIAYKACGGEEVLRTPYNGEKPNADPRKWEMASKILYATGKPEMLRALVGEELTADFTAFCRQQVISIEDVIKGNYTSRDLEMNLSEKFATAVGLSAVDEKNLEVVRTFAAKMGPEIRATFDNLWIHGDEKRLERIAELSLLKSEEKVESRRQGGMDR